MHPTQNNPLSPWCVDKGSLIPSIPSTSSDPTPAKVARLDPPATRRLTLELERPALVRPAGPTAGAAQDMADDNEVEWPMDADRRDPHGPEHERTSQAAREWQLGNRGHDAVCARLPSATAAWTRRLEFAGLPDAKDWRWLPAYRQRCPNLMEMVLPKGSDVVVPALKAHARREPDGRWVLDIAGREDGVGAFQRLCDELGRPLHEVVERPDVLGALGRPRVLAQLTRDLVPLRKDARIGSTLAARVQRLLIDIVDDDQIAVRCALALKTPRTARDRFAALEAIAAELRRAPFDVPRSVLPFTALDEAACMIDGLPRIEDVSAGSMYAAETLFLPSRPRWLDRAEAAAMSQCLGVLTDVTLTPALRAVRDAALEVLKPARAFGDMVFLSRQEEDLVKDALHLVRFFGLRVEPRAPGDLILRAMPDDAKRALARLRQWVGQASPEDALRRERWYLHLAGQAHRGPYPPPPTAGLLRGNAWESDLDAPPAAWIAAIARSRGEALALALDYRGEAVFDPEEVNRVLAERFAFGIRLRGTRLDGERIPAALRWPDAEWLDIDLEDEDRSRDPAWVRRVGTGLIHDFRCLTRLSSSHGDAASCTGPFMTGALADALAEHHRALEEVFGLLRGLVWNGRQRNQLKALPDVMSWLQKFIQLYQESTQSQAAGALPPLLGPVLWRALDDRAFAARCEALIRAQDGECADAYLRVLHQMALLKDIGEDSDAATAVKVALQFACELRADQWVIETHGGFDENLEEAMLLRQTVRTRLNERLGAVPGHAPVDAFETPIYAAFGVAGDRWRDDEATRRREQRADALIAAELESGCDTSHQCLVPSGLVGDFLAKVLDREAGLDELAARLVSDAQARWGAAVEAAGDDAEAVQAANDTASQALAGVTASVAARRREQVLPHLAALTARLSERRTDDTPSAPTAAP